METLTQVGVEPRSVEDLGVVTSRSDAEALARRLRRTGERLEGRTVWMVNSTAEGGGVAEMLSTQLPYLLGAGWDVRWATIDGGDAFFDLTKSIHNALHGAETADLGPRAHALYCEVAEVNAAALPARTGDVVLLHDPQTAGLIAPLRDRGRRVVWQCHIGTDTPNDATRQAWRFLVPSVNLAERYVFTRRSYLWDGLDEGRLRVIPPAIDALATKNASLADDELERTLALPPLDEVPRDARVVLEVSRWDRLKDPVGFVRMIEHLADAADVHLVFAGPETDGVDDDPEGADVLAETRGAWASLPDTLRPRVHLLSLPMDEVERNALLVNALQCRADVIVQKSLEEGFGLTVAEAMWKSKPVVASRVGGIQDQIEDGTNGVLVDEPADVGAFAHEVRRLLDDPSLAGKLGAAAHDRVCERFLGPRLLLDYATLVEEVL